MNDGDKYPDVPSFPHGVSLGTYGRYFAGTQCRGPENDPPTMIISSLSRLMRQ